MSIVLITARTAAFTSAAFTVYPGEGPRGFSAFGLAGAETVTLQRDDGSGTFVSLSDTDAILTATAPRSSILATGTYRLIKTATAGAAGASID